MGGQHGSNLFDALYAHHRIFAGAADGFEPAAVLRRNLEHESDMTIADRQTLNDPARYDIAAGRVLDIAQCRHDGFAGYGFVDCRHCLDFAEDTHISSDNTPQIREACPEACIAALARVSYNPCAGENNKSAQLSAPPGTYGILRAKPVPARGSRHHMRKLSYALGE